MKTKKRAKLQSIFFLSAVFVLTTYFPGTTHAETRYVTDMLYITLRSGKDTGSKVVTLRSDTPVTVLEESGRHVKVRTKNGKTGWAGAQYLSTKTPKSVIITNLEKELEQLKASVGGYKDQSAQISELTKENTQLTRDNERLSTMVEDLRKKNSRPRPPAMFWWFFAGGIVFLGGLLTGQVSKKKKFYIEALK